MKDDQIRIKVDKDLKEKFKKACDGRAMSVVLIRFIEEYIQKEGKD
jgi:hypothetical protein